MASRPPRLQIDKTVQERRKQAISITKKTDRRLEKDLFGRVNRLKKVRRFAIGWTSLIVLLIVVLVAQNNALSGYYQTRQPVSGGIFQEGVLGTFSNANPIYATNDVDLAVSKLIFAGLFKYSSRNQLIGDLAESWSVDKTGKKYTVVLRPDLVWQDGEPLTAQDVVFTYDVIQNPDAESPLRPNWVGISVEATNKRTIVFTLPNPLSSFVSNLTNGIVPEHKLAGTPMSGLRSSLFNTQSPIGAGPFMWNDLKISGSSPSTIRTSIALVPFEEYWSGKPQLRSFTVHGFARRDNMIESYRRGELNAMAGLLTMPKNMDEATLKNSYSFTLTAANMVFFRMTSDVFKDKTVRQALVLASNPDDIINQLEYLAPRVREPLLASQFAYDAKYIEQTGQAKKAAAALDKAGWYVGDDGVRAKKKQRLSFSLVAADTPEQRMVTAQLQRQWKAIGVEARVNLRGPDSFHNSLINHDYDAISYGITIGADPDVFVYWHSSQNDIRAANRLNLSEYDSDAADLALEAGRTRTGEALRKIKYREFLKAWQQDLPALGLYQPRFLYVARQPIYGLEQQTLNTAVERYDNVSNWMIRTALVSNEK